jgi:hypothetical protein
MKPDGEAMGNGRLGSFGDGLFRSTTLLENVNTQTLYSSSPLRTKSIWFKPWTSLVQHGPCDASKATRNFQRLQTDEDVRSAREALLGYLHDGYEWFL